MTYNSKIQNYYKNILKSFDWPEIVSKLCIKVSNIGRKFVKIVHIKFLCV